MTRYERQDGMYSGTVRKLFPTGLVTVVARTGVSLYQLMAKVRYRRLARFAWVPAMIVFSACVDGKCTPKAPD